MIGMIERRKQTPIHGEFHDDKAPHESPLTSPTRQPRSIPTCISSNTCKARSLLFAVASIYSTNCASLKFLETVCNDADCQEDSPAATTFVRFLLAASVCIPILLLSPASKSLYFAGIECGCVMMANYICQASSLRYIPAAKCTFIGALGVITTPLYGKFWRNKQIPRTHWISVAISILGVGILENVIPIGRFIGFERQDEEASGGIGVGDLLALGQPLAFGYAVLRIEEHLERHKHIPQRVLMLTSVQCITVCILSGIWVFCSGATISLTSYKSPPRFMGLVWLGTVTTVVAIVLQGKAFQAGASSTEAALFYSSEPVFGALFAQWLLGERLTMATYVGGGCILMACLLGSLPGHEKPKRPLMKSKQSGVWPLIDEIELDVMPSKVEKV